MSHTPGPWEVDMREDMVTHPYLIRGPGYEVTIARIPSKKRVSKECRKANAILMASAPDLLHALNKILDNVEMEEYLRDLGISAIKKADGQ